VEEKGGGGEGMDLILWVAVAALLALLGLFVAVLRAGKTDDAGAAPAGAGARQGARRGGAAGAAGSGAPAGVRRRQPGGTEEEEENEEEAAARLSARQAARAQAKEAKRREAALREAEREAKQREDARFWTAKQRESEQDKSAQQREAEEEARLAAEMERREAAELEQWRGQFEVAESGLAAASEEDRRRAEDELVQAVKSEKVTKAQAGADVILIRTWSGGAAGRNCFAVGDANCRGGGAAGAARAAGPHRGAGGRPWIVYLSVGRRAGRRGPLCEAKGPRLAGRPRRPEQQAGRPQSKTLMIRIEKEVSAFFCVGVIGKHVSRVGEAWDSSGALFFFLSFHPLARASLLR
jgi:hypothetical protein